MKLFIMTDVEGVAGVVNGCDYLTSQGRYYETARRLLTAEVNAAIQGFAQGGFDKFLVCDGHGAGAVNIELLDPRASYQRGWGSKPYPFGMNESFDACAYVGQHAKAGTSFSHLTHTGSWDVRDQRINGLSIGEYGEGALCAGELDLPVIFAAGEQALCDEAAALTPWVTTAAVLQGVCEQTGDHLTAAEYETCHIGAIHLQPEAACKLIVSRALEAARRFVAERETFKPLVLTPPYKLERFFRPTNARPARVVQAMHDSSVIELFNDILKQQPA